MLCGCGFVFNQSFDQSLLSYGEKYNNDQMASPEFKNYVDGIIEHLNLRDQKIVEIGCGNGYFLERLCEKNTGIGYDPAYTGPQNRGNAVFVRGYYRGEPADIAICRHTIEHIPDPLALIRSINAPKVFFETPDLLWIMENGAWWDFFYEHCNYFTASALEDCFRIAGYEGETRKAFGNQYLWYEGRRVGSGG